MSKAVLVMDMPASCVDCRFCIEISKGTEACCEIEFETDDNSLCRMIDNYCQETADWCPLRPVPEKKKEKYMLQRKDCFGNIEVYGEEIDRVAVGYNQCIDEILGGAE